MKRRARLGVVVVALASACGGKILVEAEPTVTSAPSKDAGIDVTKRPADAGIDVESLPPAPESSQSIDLGTYASDAGFSFVVPTNTLGFQLVVRGDKEATVALEELRSPKGELLFSGGSPKGSSMLTAEGKHWIAAAIPQPDVYAKTAVEPGNWAGKISTTAGTTHVWLTLQRTGDGLFHGGDLDLHVYVPEGLVLSRPGPSHAVDPTKAAADEAVLARIDAFFEQVDALFGIGRGRVRYHAFDRRYANLDTEERLYAAFEATSIVAERQALHIVLTNSIDLDGATGIWGIAPGVPGAARMTGTAMSAIAVRQIEESPPEEDAFTMLHEMGHFLGLSHTTEFQIEGEGGLYDPLGDTAECDGGVTDLNILRCPDHRNLMYPTALYAGGGSEPAISRAQLRVLWGSPVYRAFAAGNPPKRITPPPRPRIAPSWHMPKGVRRCVVLPPR